MRLYHLDITVTDDGEVILTQDVYGSEDRIVIAKEQARIVGEHLKSLAAE